MRRLCCFTLSLFVCVAAFAADLPTGKVLKVLPHLMDAQGRHTRSPSLYDRDAYQADLRKDLTKVSGVRFDIQWKAEAKTEAPAVLRVELRGTGVHACTVHPVGTETEFGDVQARESGDAAPKPFGPQQSARSVAEAIVRCAERPRPEVYPYWPSRGIVWLNALAPGLVDWLSARAARKAGRI